MINRQALRPSRGTVRVLLIIGAVALATALRLRAVDLLPADFDEDNYLRAAQGYAAAIRTGDWAPPLTTDELIEHPALGTLAFGAVIAPLPPAPEIPFRRLSAPPDDTLPEPHWTVARFAAGALGVATVAALALLDPLAAILLATSTWHIKYTSQVMLEALGALASLATVLLYLRSGGRSNRALAGSAVALGLTAATKYVYALVGLAIAVDWIIRRLTPNGQRSLWPLLAWGALAVAVFFAANPELWADPAGRLAASLFFHSGYAAGPSVRNAALPAWQPLVWLSQPVPWHPGVFLLTMDALVSLAALIGLPGTWKRRPVIAIWLLLALTFLLAWPTKWPQYTIVLSVPLSLCAAEGLRSLVAPIRGLYAEATARGCTRWLPGCRS